MNHIGENESGPSSGDGHSPYKYDHDESVFTGEPRGTSIFRAADSFRDFASRFTVFEDAAGSELHLPVDIGEKCEGCGADASYAVFAVVRRTKQLESMPSLDRVGSEYRIFGLPLCANCVPKAQRPEKHKGGIPVLRGCLQFLLFYFVFAIGAMAVFYYGFDAFEIGSLETVDPDKASRNIMSFIGLLVGWIIVYLLMLHLFGYIARRLSIGDRGGEQRHKAAIDKFINRLKLDRYHYLQHTDPVPVSGQLKLESLVRESHRLSGLTYLFRNHWPAGSELNTFNRTIYELSPDDYNTWGGRLSRDRTCCGCSKPASKSHRLMAYRGIAALLGGGVNGFAREYGIIELPLCSECVAKDGGIVNAGKGFTWKDYAKLVVPLIITYKNMVALEPVQNAINSGWGIGAPPDETDLELSVNLKYWFDRERVDISKSS